MKKGAPLTELLLAYSALTNSINRSITPSKKANVGYQ